MAPAYEAKLKLGFEFTAIQLYVPSKMAVSEVESGKNYLLALGVSLLGLIKVVKEAWVAPRWLGVAL